MDIIKYPRTQHIAGSRLQSGDEDLEIVRVESLWGRHVVIEEKQDGANSGISFAGFPIDGQPHIILAAINSHQHGGLHVVLIQTVRKRGTAQG